MLINLLPSPDLRCWNIAQLGFLSVLQICVIAFSFHQFNGNKLLRCRQKAAAFPAHRTVRTKRKP